MINELADDFCLSHYVNEPNDGTVYTICYECNHLFRTEQDLINADREAQTQYGVHENSRPVGDITACPHCNHDF